MSPRLPPGAAGRGPRHPRRDDRGPAGRRHRARLPARGVRVPRSFGERVRRFEEGLELMKAIWTQPSVTFSGRFWQLSGAEPHIQSWQSPAPAGLAGRARARRGAAGRPGGGQVDHPAGRRPGRCRAAARAVLRRAGPPAASPRAPQPLRRNVFLGADRDDALEQFRRASAAALPALRAQRPRGVAARRGGARLRRGRRRHVLAGRRTTCWPRSSRSPRPSLSIRSSCAPAGRAWTPTGSCPTSTTRPQAGAGYRGDPAVRRPGRRGLTVRGIHHAGIVVSDLDRAIDFYTGVLGLELMTDPTPPPRRAAPRRSC